MALLLTIHRNSANSLAPRLLLGHAGVSFEIKEPSTALHGVTDRRLPLLREAGDHTSYKSAPLLFAFICDKYIAVSRYFPSAPEHRAEMNKHLLYIQDSLTPAVRKAITEGVEDDLAAALSEVTSWLSPAGFLYGDSLTVVDVYAVCILRAWMVLDHIVPHHFHELADRVAAAMSPWKSVIGAFDRIVVRGGPDGREEVLPAGHAEAWEDAIGPSKPVQPAHVRTLARNLGVDVVHEARLLWLIKRALCTPLPPGWRVVQASAAAFFSDFSQHSESKASMTAGSRATMGVGGSRATMGVGGSRASMGIGGSRATMGVGGSRATMGVGGSRRTMGASSHNFGAGGRRGAGRGGGPGLPTIMSGMSVATTTTVARKRGGASDVDVDGEANKFLNQSTGEVTVIHPGTTYVLQQLADARRFASIMGSDLSVASLPGSGAWMRFTRPPPPEEDPSSKRRFSAISEVSGGSGSRGDGGDGVSGGGVGEKEDEEEEAKDAAGTEFWHDFESGEEAVEPPAGSCLVPYPPSPSTDQAAVLSSAGGMASPGAGTVGLGATRPRDRDALLTPSTRGTPLNHGSSLPSLPSIASRDEAGSQAPSVAGGSRRGGRRRRKPRSIEEMDTLHFKSWWKEGGSLAQASTEKRDVNSSSFRRQTLDVFFSMEDGSFKVALEGDDKVYSISHIEGRMGPLSCWDLHVGARINILGRNVTLKQATLSTQQWIDHHAVRLDKLVKRMTAELVKYDVDASHQLSKKRQKLVVKGGRTNLRAKVDFLDTLRRKLAFYRPKLAQRILEGLVR